MKSLELCSRHLKRNNILDTINIIDSKLFDDDLVQMKTNAESMAILNIIPQLKIDKHAEKNQKKSRYNNHGFCKYKEHRHNFHAVRIYETFLISGLKHGCNYKHLKKCLYWTKSE